MDLFISVSHNIEKVVLSEEDRGRYLLRVELWKMRGTPFDSDEPTRITATYNPQGHFIGDEKTAAHLCDKLGINPIKRDPSHSVCSIGRSDLDGKWYGWSHRAIYGFEPGSTCKPDDSHYDPERGEWTARNWKHAQRMARDFAESVSSGLEQPSLLAVPAIPSAHLLGEEVVVRLGALSIPANVIAITFVPGKVLYTLAVYTGNKDALDYAGTYGLVNSIGWTEAGEEYIRLSNVDSTFVEKRT